MGLNAVLRRRAQQIYRWLLHRYDNLGVRGLVGIRRMPALPQHKNDTHPFDVERGSETGGFVAGEALATGSGADLYNTAYYAISPSTLQAALAEIPGALDGFAFVDLGCGKGRALLVAAEFPFGEVVGVEIAPALAESARRNCARDGRIRVVTGDARGLEYPERTLVVFLYHPFLWPVVRDALGNLEKQLRAAPHAAWVLYANPSYDRMLAGNKFLELVWDRRFALSAEDAAADRHGISDERYALYRGWAFGGCIEDNGRMPNPSLTKIAVSSASAPPAAGPYSQAVRIGDVVYTAGQLGSDPKTGSLIEGGIAAQTEQAIKNTAAVLEAAGTDLTQVVKTSVFLQDMKDFDAMNAVYGRYFAPDGVVAPARSTVQVAALPKGGLFEIDVVAVVPQKS